MLVKQNLKQIYFIALCFVTFSSVTFRAVALEEGLLERETASNPQISLSQKIKPQLDNDPTLVGLWIHANSVCNPNSCSASSRQMLILPDGTFLQGDSQLIDANINNDRENAIAGEWKTANRIVYARANKDYQWIPVSRYQIKDGKMFLTFQDGSREVWRKSY